VDVAIVLFVVIVVVVVAKILTYTPNGLSILEHDDPDKSIVQTTGFNTCYEFRVMWGDWWWSSQAVAAGP
jgi:hypothetical protein